MAPVLANRVVKLVELAESPRDFHARAVPDPPAPEIWWNQLTEPALVLGSTQRDESMVDAAACAASGVDVVRRRSGGGAVLLIPDEVVWFDVIVPTRSVPGLGDDVHAPMLWLGDRLADLLGLHLEGELAVKGPGMATTPWSSLICFDGLGPGEVLLDGHKLIGISQRRTRAASRLQCCWYRKHDPQQLVDLLADVVRPDVADLAPVATLANADVETVLGQLSESLSRA